MAAGGKAVAGGYPGGRSSTGDGNNGGRATAGRVGSIGGTPGAAASTSTAGSDGSAGAGNGCPHQGHVTYTLARESSPSADQKAAYDKITAAMDAAVRYYNCYTDITKALNVSYNPSVATADGNINGSIRFGSTDTMNKVTAMHEISHTAGIGTAQKWSSLVVNGVFTGTNAAAQLLAIPNRLEDTLHADSQHFWPYGLNYESEGQHETDLIGHCEMVVAIRKDLGM
jgi:hypothetical protein